MVKLAKTAGFCFGVKNALNMVFELLGYGHKVCTLGNIIHNKEVVESLRLKGVRVVDSVEEVESGEVLVIRSHGVGIKVYDEIKNRYIDVKDATCPFVRRIQRKVLSEFKKGKKILIAGDRNHPEIVGIRGFCADCAFVFSNISELKNLLKKNENLKEEDFLVVAQTTFNLEVWQECVSLLASCCPKAQIFSSVCSATIERQKEADISSKNSDITIVVGGKNSSNTKKLAEICSKNCKTFFIENIKELNNLNVELKGKEIFITAGASTPEETIKEVFDKVVENINLKI